MVTAAPESILYISKELEWGHRKLTGLLPQVKYSFPEHIARAQILYDCWVEQQEENWQENDISACKMDFIEMINDIEANMHPKVADTFVEKYTVYFNFDSAGINGDGKAVIDTVSSIVKGRTQYDIRLEGHTDTSGSEEFNVNLSRARANEVKNRLMEQGVDSNAINIHAFGETMLAVPTADGVPNKFNRRVEIHLKASK